MAKQIFPSEILNFTIETQVARHSTRSQVIYVTIILMLLSAFASLPFIYVDVTVQSQGLIRPVKEITTISAPSGGRIQELHVENNTYVSSGDIILTIESTSLDSKSDYLQTRKQQLTDQIHDLHLLTSGISSSAFNKVSDLRTALYQQEYREFRQKVYKGNAQYLLTEKNWKRSKQLYEAQAIAELEYDNSKFEFDQAIAAFNTMHQAHLSEWQTKLQNSQQELEELQNQLDQLKEEESKYIVKAPVSGTVQGMDGLFKGSVVFPNQDMMKISPDSELIAETYISPNDIGLLKKGMTARFQINAFNYNQWGMASGVIKDISDDVVIHNDRPVFKVRCLLDQTFLVLGNGYKGKLKKGMTLNTRFTVNRRSLWQLLYDKVDDWLNPNLSKQA